MLWNAALETGGFLVGDEMGISVSIQTLAEPESYNRSCSPRMNDERVAAAACEAFGATGHHSIRCLVVMSRSAR